MSGGESRFCEASPCPNPGRFVVRLESGAEVRYCNRHVHPHRELVVRVERAA